MTIALVPVMQAARRGADPAMVAPGCLDSRFPLPDSRPR